MPRNEVITGPFPTGDVLGFCRYIARRELVRRELADAPTKLIAQPMELAAMMEIARFVEGQATLAQERAQESMFVSIPITSETPDMVSWVRESEYLKFAHERVEGHIRVYWEVLRALVEEST